VSGNLEQILQSLVSQLENDMKLSKDLRKALSYPAFVIAALIMAFVVFITYVIPNFAPIFEKSSVELPLPTRMILLMSDLFISYGIVLLIVLVVTGLAFYSYYKSEKGKYMTHYYLLKLPLIGDLLKKVSSQRFSSTISILIRQGIPLVQAMTTAIKTESNRVFKENIAKIQEKVESGQSISAAMQITNIFPKMMIQMVSVGELTGTLELMMGNIAEITKLEISNSVENLTSLIEPVITVVLAVMVLFLALSIFLQMWNMMDIR
jgi:type II secretory pathway component PulF